MEYLNSLINYSYLFQELKLRALVSIYESASLYLYECHLIGELPGALRSTVL